MATTILTHNSAAADSEPANLAQGELAVNTTDKKLWVGDGTATPVPLVTGQGGATTVEIELVAHGFSNSDCIRFDGTTWVLAQADSQDTTALGVVVDASDPDLFVYAMSGRFEVTHGLATDEWFFLSDTVAGGLTAVAPKIEQPLVYTDDSTHFSVYPYRPSDTTAITPLWEAGTDPNDIVNTNSGNVGIGTAAPKGRLDVVTATASQLRVSNNEAGYFGNSNFAHLSIDQTANSGITIKSGVANQGGIAFQNDTYAGNARTSVNGGIYYNHTDNRMELWTNKAERMRIDSAGNVGIGTTTPNSKLDVNTGTNTDVGDITITLGSPNAGVRRMEFVKNTDTATERLFTLRSSTGGSSSPIAFATSSTNERMRIDSVGNLLVGITSLPTAGGGGYAYEKAANRGLYSHSSTSAHAMVLFYNPNGIVGSIQTSGTSTSYVTSSDYRLKENVVPMTGALDRVALLRPSQFNFIADAAVKVDGFIAHEAQAVVPEAVTGKKDGEEMQGIDQSKLVPLLTAAIQELTARLEVLENV